MTQQTGTRLLRITLQLLHTYHHVEKRATS
jgi:hypothetical protein